MTGGATLSEPSKDADRAPPKGLYCRGCWGQLFKVWYTRSLSRGRIRRCRICEHCGKKMWTTEHDVGNTRPGR